MSLNHLAAMRATVAKPITVLKKELNKFNGNKNN